MDGFELLRRLRADSRTRGVPVILLSTGAGEESRAEALDAGADDHLGKPFGARELLARIGSALAMAQLRRSAVQREQELRAELTDVVESMTDAFITLDPGWRMTYVNAAAEKITGMPRAHLLGGIFWEMFRWVLGTDIERAMRRVMAERRPARIEDLRTPSGRWFEIDIHPTKADGVACYARDVMDRRFVEERLRQSEALLAEAQHLARIGSWNLDLSNWSIQWSDEQYRLFGLEPREVSPTYARFLQLLHPDDRDVLRAVTAKARRDHQPFEYTFRAVHPDGTVRVLRSRGKVAVDEHGMPTRLFGMLQDITERLEAEAAQRKLQRERDELIERLQLQFERMPIACIVFDPEMRVLEFNPAAETTFGYRRDEIVGTDGVSQLVPPERRALVQETFRRVAAGETPAPVVHENVTKDGRTIICEWRNTPLRDGDGRVIANLAMALDITDRVWAETALRESEERYRLLISQVKEFAIFSTDDEGLVTTWNEGCEHVLGYRQEEFMRLDSAELYTSEDRAADLPAVERHLGAEAGTTLVERWMVARGGRRFFAMGAMAGLRDAAGDLIGFSMVIRDLTRMKLSQDELAHRGERLERLVSERTGELEVATKRLRLSERMAALGTLAAGLGHDVGNLLLPLEVRLSLFDQAELSPELRDNVAGIYKCLGYLKRLSNGLRMLAVDSSAARAMEPTELSEWWADVSSILRNVVPTGIRFEHDLPSAECWVAIGNISLTQAVFNLVQNAADSLRERGVGVVRIEVEDDPAADTVRVRVRDDGPGMPARVVQRCLDPYFTTKTRGVSTGMGLPIVHSMLSAAGGRMEIDSDEGRGTTVHLILQRAQVHGTAAERSWPLSSTA
jgi:PAS domain S-box-containing protein